MACKEDGRFEVQRLPAGSYMIGAWQENGGEATDELAYTFTEWIPLKQAAQEKDIRIELRLGGTVEGVVLDKQGRPFAGAAIWVRDAADANLIRSVETDADGKFTTGLVRPGPIRVFGFFEGKYTNLLDLEMEPAGRSQVKLKF